MYSYICIYIYMWVCALLKISIQCFGRTKILNSLDRIFNTNVTHVVIHTYI